ncbi:class I SAM-dependent methyltransferase [Algihabitans albus]|uniref:class I SAM-dependent methyltransferase n=1 Tax=Algihabitans albus TaxID=2164067 RepID=UPI001F2CFC92|nr:class I SAM-dependent methyltransferase [Algihabitans albus]
MSKRGAERAAQRLRLMGLQTLIGGGPTQGFFIPYRYADRLPRRSERPPYAAVAAIFEAAKSDFLTLFDRLDSYSDALQSIGVEAQPPNPRWDQDWFPRLDAGVAYVFVRDRTPRRIVEIGSGHSTRFFARAVADAGLATRIDAIDPAPRADLAGLPVTLHRTTLQRVDLSLFDELAAGDIVSIDSSHILMPGTDVDLFLGQILPRLPDGMLLHVHDIFLPDFYPAVWEWRGYNEQQAWAPLLALKAFRPLWSSHWASTRLTSRLAQSVAARLPLRTGAFESSLWLEKFGHADQTG